MSIQKELDQLKQDITLMARKAEAILDTALQVLETRNDDLAKEVFEMDTHLDKMEVDLDRKCMLILALKDPYAVDFRFIFSVIKTTRDLERVGDESKSIVKWSRKMVGKADPDILELGRKSREALNTAIAALSQGDAEVAQKVMDIEFLVDKIEDRIMESSPNLPMAFIAKALERISDMATNVAENVIFSVRAEDIRHGGYTKI